MPDLRSKSPTSRLRLLFLIPSFKTGGAEMQLLSLVRGLDKATFDVVVAAFYRGNELDAAFESITGVTVLYLEKRGSLDLRPVRRLTDYLRRRPVDVLQAINVSARLIGVLCAKMARVPMIVATERTSRPLYASFGSRIYLALERFALRTADLVIANSEAGRRFVAARGVPDERIRVIYNGVDLDRLASTQRPQEVRAEMGLPESAFVVGMTARIEASKDPALFVAACGRVMSCREDVCALLVGDGPLLQRTKQLAQQTGFSNRFVFAGRRADVADLFSVMDVVLLTSRKIEGCSNALLEAMALGRAVVATRVGGNVEVIAEEVNGLLVAPGDAHELAAAIIRLHDDRALRQRLGENGCETVRRRFSQTAMVRAYESLYRSFFERAKPVVVRDGRAAQSTGRPFERSHVLGCPVDRMTISQCLDHFETVIAAGRTCHIVVVNAAKVVKARSDRELAEIIAGADLVGADGVPVVWASRLLGEPLPARVNGTDLMEALFALAARKGYRVFLLGARQPVIENAVRRLGVRYPTLRIAGYRHGYFDSLEDERQAVQMINEAQPDILMLGMSTPMKEHWVRRHKELLKVPIIHGVGGSFDIVGGITKRAPKWMQVSGLEWLFRLIQEPRRMWRRYLVTNAVFTGWVLRACIVRLLKNH